MAYWGEGMSSWHQIWGHPDADDQSRLAGLKKAEKLYATTERERDYIAALKLFYSNGKQEHEKRARLLGRNGGGLSEISDDRSGGVLCAVFAGVGTRR
jgi:hypothetical protein